LRGVGGAVFLAWLAGALWYFDFSPARLWNGLSGLATIVRLMIPPAPGELWLDILRGLAESVAMAFLGTFVAAVIAVPLGFLGAANVVTATLLRFSLRRVFDGMRGVDQLIWALAFVRAVGLGPLAGVLAIATADIAVLAKLNAEAIENAERRQVEGVAAAGGGRLAQLRFGVLPQVLPVMLAQALYFFVEQHALRRHPRRGRRRRHRAADRRAHPGTALGRGGVHHPADDRHRGGDRLAIRPAAAAADRRRLTGRAGHVQQTGRPVFKH